MIVVALFSLTRIVPIGIVNASRPYGRTIEWAPRSIYSDMINLHIQEIGEQHLCRTGQCYFEFKQTLSNTSSLYDQFNVRNILDTFHMDGGYASVILRISTTPHRVLSHFDCGERFILMLNGTKEILTYRLTHLPVRNQVEFLHHVRDMHLHHLMRHLQVRNIAYEKRTLRPGSKFFIPPGMYHFVENNYATSGLTVMINVDYREDETLHHSWDQMWRYGTWIDKGTPFPSSSYADVHPN